MRSFLVAVAAAVLAVGCGPKTSHLKTPPAVAVTPVGKPVGALKQQMVPTTGGTLVSSDGRLTLDIPSGALASATMFTVVAINNEAPKGKGPAYRLGPDGTTFSAPVKLTFKYTAAELAASEAAALGIASQDAMGQWRALKMVTVNETAKTITGETKHFSDWTLLTGWQLKPASTSLAAGGAVDLTVELCGRKSDPVDELTALVVTCAPDDGEFFVVNEWAANGKVNGDSTVGTVMSTGTSVARYSAPSAPPANNPVSVSASATDKTTGRKTILVASVWVDSHPPYSGTITSRQVNSANLKDILTTSASVRLLFNTTENAYRPASGTVFAQMDIINTVMGCETHLSYDGPLTAMDGFMTVEDGTYFVGGNKITSLTGTTNCNTNKVTEALSQTVGVLWWPAPQAMLTAKPDGRLDENLTNLAGGDRTVDVYWSLAPE